MTSTAGHASDAGSHLGASDAGSQLGAGHANATLVVLGGRPLHPRTEADVLALLAAAPATPIVAVDSGLHAVHALGLRASAAIGDMDSVAHAELDAARGYGARLVTLSRDKDETDAHAALALALEWPHGRIVVATGGGGRLDHELGVLGAIFDPRLAGRAVELWRGDSVAYALVGDAVRAVRTRAGEVVGLAAMHGAAGGIDTEGLRWALADARLEPHETRGASNEALGGRVVVRVREGRLLVVHERGLT